MEKKDKALGKTLLGCAWDIMESGGPGAINIRLIAKDAGVSVGTVYNYFSNKDDILLALTEEYWEKILVDMQVEIIADPFYEQLEEIYAFLSKHIRSSAGILMHSLVSVEAAGRERMQYILEMIRKDIVQRMKLDANIRLDIWNETFTRDQYAQFIIMNMMLYLRGEAFTFDFFIEIVKRTIY